MGRKKEYPVRITLPLSEEMAEGVDQARGDEDRVTWIRDAIAKRLKKREKKG
jgi:metal-responsive CopG/Arc/MetJ family transcriptional regulator